MGEVEVRIIVIPSKRSSELAEHARYTLSEFKLAIADASGLFEQLAIATTRFGYAAEAICRDSLCDRLSSFLPFSIAYWLADICPRWLMWRLM